MSKKSILLVEDHALFRAGIASIIQQSEHFELVGEAQTGPDAIEMVLDLLPELIIMDIALPELNGIECTKRILALFPNIQILALTWHEDQQTIVEMITAGAKGFLNKNTTAKELLAALTAIASGNHYYSPLASSALISKIRPQSIKQNGFKKSSKINLTARELEITRLIFEEYTNKEIAEALYISTKTVETHKRNILQKLKLKGTAGLVKFYLRTQIQLFDLK
jgi:DNA-binding NarL/FixJ family response regulator